MGPRHNLFLYIRLTHKVTKKTRLQCCSILMQSNIHFQQSPQYYIKFFSSCFGIVETVTTMPFFFFYTSSLFKKGSSGETYTFYFKKRRKSAYFCLLGAGSTQNAFYTNNVIFVKEREERKESYSPTHTMFTYISSRTFFEQL